MPVLPPSGHPPPMIERNMNARALLPTHKPILDFFRASLSTFQSSSTPFSIICTLTPRPPPGPAQLLQHRILAAPSPQPPSLPPARLVVLDSSFNPPTTAHLRMARDALVSSQTQRQNEKGEGETRLLLLLSINNADKAPKPAAFEQRLAMMWAFAKDVRSTLEAEAGEQEDGAQDTGGVAIDIALSTQPFFHDKSAAIAADDFYKGTEGRSQEGQTEQVILAGYDTLIRIFNPKYYSSSSAASPSSPPSSSSSNSSSPIFTALNPFFSRARLRVTMRTDDEWGGKDEQSAYIEKLLHGDELEKIGGSKAWADRVDIVDGTKEGEEVVSSTLARKAVMDKDWDRLGRLVPGEVKKWLRGDEGLYEEE